MYLMRRMPFIVDMLWIQTQQHIHQHCIGELRSKCENVQHSTINWMLCEFERWILPYFKLEHDLKNANFEIIREFRENLLQIIYRTQKLFSIFVGTAASVHFSACRNWKIDRTRKVFFFHERKCSRHCFCLQLYDEGCCSFSQTSTHCSSLSILFILFLERIYDFSSGRHSEIKMEKSRRSKWPNRKMGDNPFQHILYEDSHTYCNAHSWTVLYFLRLHA